MVRFLSSILILLFLLWTESEAAMLSGTVRGLGHASEPAALALVGSGLMAIGFMRRRFSGD